MVSVEEMEEVIRDLAATVVNSVQTRRDHPSYGVTRTKVRAEVERMEGAIGLYMVITGQAMHPGVPSLANFKELATSDRVQMARRMANNV